MSLNTKAMIVYFSCGLWTAKKLDKKVTEQICDQNNTTKDWARGHKSLIEKDAVRKVRKVLLDARAFHYSHTLPWGDNGDRLLSTDLYFDYSKKMEQFKEKFEDVVSDFLANYENLINTAKVKLNGLFNGKDYPDKSKLAGKFYYKISVMPIPQSNDLRVDLNEKEIQKIKSTIDDAYNVRLKESLDNIYKRIFEAIKHISDRLADKDPVFRDSLIGNVKELCNLLPKLNITNDENINNLIEDIKSTICKADPDTLRENKKQRTAVKTKADEILNKMKGFYNAEQSE
jgi:hypothetical protein